MNDMAQIFFMVGLCWGIIAITLLLVAWVSIVRGAVRLHRVVMILLMTGGWLFVVFYLLAYYVGMERSVEFDLRLRAWIATHGTMALLSLILVSILVWARLTGGAPVIDDDEMEGSSTNKGLQVWLNSMHPRIGTFAAVFWILSNIGGILNIFLLSR